MPTHSLEMLSIAVIHCSACSPCCHESNKFCAVKQREKICQDLVNLKGRKVLFVVDSFDQVNEQQMDGTVFQQLVDKNLLPNATLMVLSRSMESCHDNPLFHIANNLGINQYIKISGFNKDHYIASACSNELLAALKSYLSSHPLIYSQMCIPVRCAAITGLFCLHWNRGDKGFFSSYPDRVVH